jgi:hypothetical protein
MSAAWDQTDNRTVPSSSEPLGTAEPHQITTVPGSAPYVREPGTVLYGDVAGLLDGTIPDPPEPDVLQTSDGVSLLYSGQMNHVFGDPESGKTWLCLAAIAQTLANGDRAAVLDLDHNGMAATVTRLLDLGAPESALRDLDLFRYVEPDDAAHLLTVVADLGSWRAQCIVLDSLGELLPMFGASSNSPDDYTRVHSLVLKPLAKSGAAVAVIDHLAKGTDSRAMGATGTAAKKRTIGGVSLRVTVADPFTPGKGGRAYIAIAKDRHGGLRAHRPTGDKEPLAGTFQLYGDDHAKRWDVHAPDAADRNPGEAADPADVEALRQLDPPPATVADAATRMQWRKARAAAALREFRATVPGSHTQGSEPGTAPACPVCGGESAQANAAHDYVHPGCEVAA